MTYDKQVALQLQRGRAILYVTEYFAKSLKITWNDTLEYGVCKPLLVFHWNYVCIPYRFWYIQRQRPWNWG